jgi:hypothetical protein
MNRITLLRIIELTAQMLEFVGVVVIGISFIYASFRGLSDYRQKKTDAYDRMKNLYWNGFAVGVGISRRRGRHQYRDRRANHGKDTVPRTVDYRANAFELVHRGRSRRVLALAGSEE